MLALGSLPIAVSLAVRFVWGREVPVLVAFAALIVGMSPAVLSVPLMRTASRLLSGRMDWVPSRALLGVRSILADALLLAVAFGLGIVIMSVELFGPYSVGLALVSAMLVLGLKEVRWSTVGRAKASVLSFGLLFFGALSAVSLSEQILAWLGLSSTYGSIAFFAPLFFVAAASVACVICIEILSSRVSTLHMFGRLEAAADLAQETNDYRTVLVLVDLGALDRARDALERIPGRSLHDVSRAYLLVAEGQAAEAAQIALERISPGMMDALSLLVFLACGGDARAALERLGFEEARVAPLVDNWDSVMKASVAWALAASGRTDEARSMLPSREPASLLLKTQQAYAVAHALRVLDDSSYQLATRDARAGVGLFARMASGL